MSRSSKPRPKPKPRKSARKRANRTTQPSPSVQRSGLGSIIATGIRSLTPYLPMSQALAPIADFALKQIGLTVDDISGKNFAGSVNFYGVMAKLVLTRANLVAACGQVVPQIGGNSESYFYSEYQDVRIDAMTVVVQPDSKLANRAGVWWVGFTPFEQIGQDTQEIGDNTPLSPSVVKRHLISVSGPFSRPLTIKYSPKPYDGLAYQFTPINSNGRVSWDASLSGYYQPTRFGMLAIYYEDLARSDFGEFNPSDFCFEVSLSATCHFRRPFPENAVAYSSDVNLDRAILDKIEEPFSSVRATVINRATPAKDTKRHWAHLGGSNFQCSGDAKARNCSIIGTILASASPINDFEMLD